MLITKNVHISSEAIRYHFAGAFCRRSFSLCKSANSFIAYRSQYGSVNPVAIVVPGLIATAVSTLVGMIICKLMSHQSKSS